MFNRVILAVAALLAAACTGGGSGGFCTNRSDCDGGACVNGTCEPGDPNVAPMEVSSLLPGSGPVGTTVTVTGSGFGSDAGAVHVAFGGVAADITSVSATRLVVTAPAHAAGEVPVTITVGNAAAVGVPSFTYTSTAEAPVVSSISPDHGPPGTTVTVSGTGFGAAGAAVQVTFGGDAATVLAVTATQLSVAAPVHAPGAVAVAVRVDGAAASNQPTFTFEAAIPSGPQVSGLSPAQGWPGEPVTISGSGFAATTGENVVRFGSATAQVTAASATQLTVIAPPAGKGSAQVTVTAGGLTAATQPTFTFRSEIVVTPRASLPPQAVVANPGAIGEYAGFALGGVGYVVNSAGLNYQYDPGSDSWSPRASLAPAYPGAWGFSIGSRGYVGFGYAGYGQLGGVAAYDPGSDAWSPLTFAGAVGIGGVYQPYATLVVSGNRVIIGNGAASQLYTGTIDGGTITWSQSLSYPDPNPSIPLVLSDGTRTYWGGGYLGNNQSSTSFYRFEPAGSGSWIPVAPLPDGMYRSYQDDAFVIGDDGFVVNDAVMWVYSFATETWRAVEFGGIGSYEKGYQQASFTIGDVAYELYADGSFYAVRYEGPNPYAE
jgi:hypothetical protein